MERDRLALSVTLADGSVVRWGGDEPDAERVPGDLEFGTSLPGGYKDLRCSLLRRLAGAERLFNRVRVYGSGNRTAWDGRLAQFPRDDLAVNPGAVGWAAHMRDDPSVREIYVDGDLSNWTGPTLQRRLNLIGSYTASDPRVVGDPQTAQPSLALSHVGGWTATSKMAPEALYVSGMIPLGSLYWAWKRNGNVDNANTNWSWQAGLLGDPDAGTGDLGGNQRAAGPGTQTVTATTATRYWGYLGLSFAIGPIAADNTEYAIYVTCAAAYGTHGLTKQGVADATHAQGFYGHDLIQNLVSRWAPMLTATIGAGGIEENRSFIVPQAAFPDATTVESAVLLINGYFQAEWGVYDDLLFFWRQPDPSRLVWRVRKDSGAHVSMEGETGEAQFNGVLVSFTDVNGQKRSVGPPAAYWEGGVARCDATNATLVDASPLNAVNMAGIPRRWGVLNLTETTTDDGAVQLGTVWLAEHALPQRRGSIVVSGLVEHPTEGPVPVWRVRAGDGVVVTDMPGDEPRRIIETRYVRGDDAISCTVGNTDFKMDAIMERMGAQLIGVI